MTEIKLASELKISRDEALALMNQYFKAFPRIKELLDKLGRFGVRYGYSRTMAPYFRRRYYPDWKYVTPYVKAYLNGVDTQNQTLASIERASKNMPIQGSAGDQIKTASCITRFYIKDHNLRDRVKPNLQVHDENVSLVRDDTAEEWSNINKSLMEEAALMSIPSGLLKADAGISERWTK